MPCGKGRCRRLCTPRPSVASLLRARLRSDFGIVVRHRCRECLRARRTHTIDVLVIRGTDVAQHRVVEVFADNLHAYLDGRPLTDVIEWARG